MSIDLPLATSLILHCILLLVKVYSVYFLMGQMIFLKTPNNKNYMFIFKPLEFMLLLFSFAIVLSEIYFISSFFIDGECFIYDYLAVNDEIAFTILTLYYLKRGGQNENTN